jgi:hypothetical protein
LNNSVNVEGKRPVQMVRILPNKNRDHICAIKDI